MQQMPRQPRRIAVVGASGSGKTTLARDLASRLSLPHVELDALLWEPNWTPAPQPLLRQRVDEALAGDGWVVDGNYRELRDLIWGRAEFLIWLDYSLTFTFRRLFWRTLRRSLRREELWSANRESLLRALSRDSILLWLLQTHGRYRREYTADVRRPEYAHLRVVRLKKPGQAAAWVGSLVLASAPATRG